VLAAEIQTVCEREGITYEAIVIDDGSKDGTFACVQGLAAKDPRISGVQFRRNCCKAAGPVRRLLAHPRPLRHHHGRGSPGQPAEIPGIIKMLEDGADLVSGWKKKRYDPLGKTIPSKVFKRHYRQGGRREAA